MPPAIGVTEGQVSSLCASHSPSFQTRAQRRPLSPHSCPSSWLRAYPRFKTGICFVAWTTAVYLLMVGSLTLAVTSLISGAISEALPTWSSGIAHSAVTDKGCRPFVARRGMFSSAKLDA